jgi:two-component system, chemotaxis family, protein-glutamate methylesterase/glutaminase
MIRVLVIEDSLTIRKRIVEVLSADRDLEVVGEGETGRAAIELAASLRPDIITLDMMLPVMTGLAATEYIMAHMPTPILVVSASTNRGEAFRTYDALAAGAVDVLEKPLGNEVDSAWERKLVSAVKLVARIKVITHVRAKLLPSPLPSLPQARAATGAAYRAVGIGVSTGGPAALQQILRALPADFPLPLLVVIHIAEPFAAAFADWLDAQSPIRVRFARDGEPLPTVGTPCAIMAPATKHLALRGGRLRLTDEPERHSCRPSVDTLFESVAVELGEQAIACLLTGMGKDGAAGLLAVRRAGGMTIAQDEATSIVFGMPREAILLSAAKEVLPLAEVAPMLAELARPGGKT